MRLLGVCTKKLKKRLTRKPEDPIGIMKELAQVEKKDRQTRGIILTIRNQSATIPLINSFDRLKGIVNSNLWGSLCVRKLNCFSL